MRPASIDFETTASCSSKQFGINAQFPCTRACPVLQCKHQPEQSVSRSVSPQSSFSKVKIVPSCSSNLSADSCESKPSRSAMYAGGPHSHKDERRVESSGARI